MFLDVNDDDEVVFDELMALLMYHEEQFIVESDGGSLGHGVGVNCVAVLSFLPWLLVQYSAYITVVES